MPSIFSKIYKYRQRERRNERENFLTEIFAHCLQEERDFFVAFLQKVGMTIEDNQTYLVKTQSVYAQGRPDLEIFFGDVHLLIECKIGQLEGPGQLEQYEQILQESNVPTTKLIYLTWRYEDMSEKKVDCLMIRWYQIYQIISQTENQLLIEMKKYLKEQNMHSENFNYLDITSLQQIGDTYAKMNQVLNEVTPYFEKYVLEGARDSYFKRFRGNHFTDYRCSQDSEGFHYCINYGFGWGFWKEEEVFVYLDIRMAKDKGLQQAERYAQLLLEEMENAGAIQLYDTEEAVAVGFVKPMASFFEYENQIEEITKFLLDAVKELKRLKKKQKIIFS